MDANLRWDKPSKPNYRGAMTDGERPNAEPPKPVEISFGPDGKPRIAIGGEVVDADEFLAKLRAATSVPDA